MYCDQILWHRQAQLIIKLLYRHPWKVFRETLPKAFERPQVIINTLNKLEETKAELKNL